jgi:hypothetical protein
MEATSPRRWRLAWLITLGATAASTYALDAVATGAGVLLVATGVLAGAGHAAVLAFLAASYVAWGIGLRANLGANRRLLARTATSTNVLSKLGFDLAARRFPRRQGLAADAGYVLTELVKEAPYYAGAFGTAVVTHSVSANDALVFLGGANLGAAFYEYGLSRLTLVFLRRPYPARGGSRQPPVSPR